MPDPRLKTLEERTRYEPAEVEQRIMGEWLEAGYFDPEATGEASDNYSAAIPPPNVTGALHLGHALNGSVQDALIRMRRMQGINTMWILGTDHAGIATQKVVEKELGAEGTTLEELGRERFEERVWQWREQYGSTIIEQYKRLGASCDYGRERFTLDPEYVRAVYRVFTALFDKGYIYRDYYMVNWDPGARSAISDLEVEERQVEDVLYSIDYPLAGGGGHVTIATVRPETMLADTAVAVHPEDERYTDLVGKTAVLPLMGRELTVITDEFVKPEFGTGALKITPGHDPNDFEIGRKHGLEEITVIGEDGRMTEAAGERFAGLSVKQARAAVVEALEAEGLIRKREPYVHAVPHSHRSGEPIEPLISLQWFMRMDELAKPAIEVVEQGLVRFTPTQQREVYLEWMRNIRPWCVSRQLWWGHRLPVWYCDPCEETFVGETAPERCGSCGGELRQEEDVLDTWFSSALWPFATLGWPQETPELRAFYPTDFLTTAREILFLWVARMIMMGLEFTGNIPFEDVYVHSVILAPDGRRMSKSLGTGIDPLEEIDRHGADALRFGLLAMSSSQDVRYSAEKVQQGQDLANKMWNASRLVLLNVTDVEPEPRPTHASDRWIISRLQAAIAEIGADLDAYNFSRATLRLYSYFWNDFCDWYLELCKQRLYEQEGEGKEALSATLLWVLEQTLALAHPLMPFVTEEIYSFLPRRPAAHLAVHRFPRADEGLRDPEAERELGAVIEATTALRRYRDQVGAPAAARLAGRLVLDAEGEGAALSAAYEAGLGAIARLARFDIELAGADGDVAASVPVPGGVVEVLPSEAVDPAGAERRLEQRRVTITAELERARQKLANQSFVEKAPPEVVQAEREKLERHERELAELEGG